MSNPGPKHPLSKWFLAQFPVSSLTNFKEFESRVAALPNERARGDAFEVFAEAWLATQRIPQARNVWPGNTAPISLQEKLKLPIKDMGVDGIFESTVEETTCYQVKFRTGRPRLSWSELSTFFGLADAECGRLVFTNCDEVVQVAKDRRDVVFVRGGDLDRLTADDFLTIAEWLYGAVIIRKTKEPMPHQKAAIVDILAGFERHPRVTALMACATGKTLVALWVAERLGVKNVLVLLPSLALVRQTLHEWLHETNWPDPQYRCVCSDATVLPEEDALIVRQADLDFKVTTDSASVRRFLERPASGVRMIFSTYQSSAVVADAASGLPPFDLGIFDEAHKTAGPDGLKSSLALKDEQLPILRRLFLTATPRHYSISAREKSGAAKAVFSMDVPEIYGAVAHRLPFSAAARAGIITNYKVVISIVTSSEVTEEALRRGIVLIKGDKVKARQVANQIALKAAVTRYGVRKIFTFHGRVASAGSFVSSGPEGIATHLPHFHCDHISGAMPTGQRERRMNEFASKPRALMSNARCLTEGVDVPAVDMVAFLSPRRSLVDIVQAAGRAMRRAEGKTFGYVFVPLYVEQSRGESTLEAVERSNFDEVWNVLNRLQEHDDLLAQIIDQMQVQRSETGGYDDSRFRERVDILSQSLSLEDLRSSITAACIDALGDPWTERYGQLVAYHKKHGNCDVPVRYKLNKKLATWVVAQRYERRQGNLPQDRIDRLNLIGFTWDPYSAEWRGNYLALLAFKGQHGHCRVPVKSKEYKILGAWTRTQRSKRKTLSEERVRLLDKIGFEWHTGLATWDERFAELVSFKEKFGHTRVPVTWKENKKLAGWVVRQRVWRRAGKINPTHSRLLEELGFDWDLIPDASEQWTVNIEKLRGFKNQHGHVMVSEQNDDDRALSRWLSNIRRLKKENKLSEEQTAALDELGIAWNAALEIRTRQWEKKFQQLKRLHEITGSCELERGAVDRETKLLRSWINDQRQLKRSNRLAPERITRLDSLGFNWTAQKFVRDEIASSISTQKSWELWYADLAEFFRKNGHCDVPENWDGGSELVKWVNLQRKLKSLGRMDAEHEIKLNELSFSWAIFDARWEHKFAALKTWLEIIRRGKKLAPPLVLNRWMVTQRQHLAQGVLPKERKARLDAAGFEWAPLAEQWDKMFETLKQYKVEHGHCRVPAEWSSNPQLSRWVGVQRARKISGKLLPAREQALDNLGFTWSTGRRGVGLRTPDAWNRMFDRLASFYANQGHSRVPQGYADDIQLGRWVSNQRLKYKLGKLTRDQIDRLQKLEFVWAFTASTRNDPNREISPFDQRWAAMFEILREFRKTHDHCRVPTAWAANKQLANWVAVQRRRMKKKKLSDERIAMLETLGFEWTISLEKRNPPLRTSANSQQQQVDKWPELFAALSEYKNLHGDCRVPQLWKGNRQLAGWVGDLRIAHKKGRLNPERQRLLNELGFDWNPISTRWETMFAQLVEYKKRFGHTNVQSNSKEYEKLGNWVKMQRRDKHIGRAISHERAKRLDALGFTWRFVEPLSWDSMFELLSDFRKRNGHCNVPQRFIENIKFGRWVNTQRIRFKHGRLSDEKIQRLNELGFSWNTKTASLHSET